MNFNFIVATAIVIFISMYSIVADKPWESSFRLSTDVRPQQYYINLYPDLEQGLFSGSVIIKLTLNTPQSYIVLHSKELNITETKLNSSCVKAFSYPENEFWVVEPNEELRAGEYELQMSFEGSLLDKIEGLYRSEYTDSKCPDKHYIANTQFMPINARTAFPCFDEPALKSNFKISITRPRYDNYLALSNMNQECEEVDVPTNGLTTVHFANTPPMSTYLVFLIVCDFKSLDPVKTDQGFLLTVYARSEQIENMKYAKGVGLEAINFFLKYFEYPYTLPKLDMIALPELQLASTDNLGIIAFDETYVVYKEGVTSKYYQKDIVLNICLEMAYMWCGELTTTKWWDESWFFQGLAALMEFKALGAINCDWDADSLFLIEKTHVAQNLDSKSNTHSLTRNVSNSDEINETFDDITNAKSSAVLRMLEEAVSEEVFRTAVNEFFKCFAFKNAESGDFWEQLHTVTQNHANVKKVMSTWTDQKGFPMVSVLREGTKLILYQQRFLSFPINNSRQDSSPYGYKWDIPMTYITSNDNTVTKFWFNKNNDSITLDISDAEWIKLNHKGVGFYIINYSENDWYLLSKLLENNVDALCAADRLNLLNDAFMLASNHYLSYGDALNMTKYIPNELDYGPWNVFEIKIIELRMSLFERPALQKLEKYVQHLFESINVDVWNDACDRNFPQGSLRRSILNVGCLNGVPSYLTKVHELFIQFLDNNVQLHADIKGTILYNGVALSNECEWNKMWDLYLNEQEPQAKIRFLDALTASKDTSLLNKLLQYAKNVKYVSSKNYLLVLYSISDNSIGTQVVWDFLRKEWQNLVKIFSLDDVLLGALIPWVCSKFNSLQRLEEMKTFFNCNPNAGVGNVGRNVAIERVYGNMIWLECNEAVINNWLMNC